MNFKLFSFILLILLVCVFKDYPENSNAQNELNISNIKHEKSYQGHILSNQKKNLSFKYGTIEVTKEKERKIAHFCECMSNQIEITVPNSDINKLELEKECKIVQKNRTYRGKITENSRASKLKDGYCLKIKPCDCFEGEEDVKIEISLK